jgi:predicted GNAT family N-acyltransferase
MTDSELLLSPRDDGDAVELSQSQRVYRKRILPKATINYRGRKITFDDAYLNDLANSYKEGAYDQVAFMLADTNNAHTLDPERFRGEVQGVEVGEDGLYGIFQVTPEAAQVLEQNPKLGVSARILENYERSDGKHFPRALQHVLGTLDPVIPGLGAWEEVALSNGVALENVLDLSATSYEELEHMATRAELTKQVAEATDMSPEDLEALGMTDEELEVFASAFAPSEEVAAEVTEPDEDELIEEPGEEARLFDTEDAMELPSEAEIEAAVEALSDEELAELAAELDIDSEGEPEAETEAEAEAETEETAEAEPVAQETPEEPAEPTDADLIERLATGDFNSGLGTEDPTLGRDADLGDLSDADLAGLDDLWAPARDRDEAASRLEAEVEEAAAAEAAETVAVEEASQAEDTSRELVGAGSVSLSNEAPEAVVELSNQVNRLQQQLAEQQFTALRSDYIRQGVPAALVDLARPILVAGPAATLEFSNAVGGTDSVDAAHIVRQLLDSATGYIDLARERGHSFSPDKDEQAAMAAEEDKHLASLWASQYGI